MMERLMEFLRKIGLLPEGEIFYIGDNKILCGESS